jgi:hypothetical protein
MNGVKPGKSFKITLSVTVADGSVCSASSFSGRAWTGNTQGGTEFSASPASANVVQVYVGCDGILNCGDQVGNLDPPLDGTPLSGLTRGANNGGPACVAIPYSFDFITSGTQTAVFATIKNGQVFSVEYVMAWNPVALPASGWADFRPQVSWGVVGHNPPVPGTTDYVPALACLSDDLGNPAAIMPTIPDDSLANPPGPYSTSPFGQFHPGQQAQMCVSEHDWALVNVAPINQPPVWKIQYLDRVIDQSDGHVTGP